MAVDRKFLLGDLLKATSRSFYLTLRVLPAGVRAQIGLAYLLARTTDTIADTEIVPWGERLAALARLRGRILGLESGALNFGGLARQQGSAAERTLLEQVEVAVAGLEDFSAADQARIRTVLATITSGQELDLQRFGGAGEGIRMLASAAELEDYTYRVAGCVGEFWTEICRAHLFPEANLNEAQLRADGIRFGQGLQLVNILRDLPVDLRNGRCYLPADELRAAGLRPEELLEPSRAGVFLPLFRRHLDRAEEHLAAGWRYTNTLPYGQFRVRLACAWPVLIGLRTLVRLRRAGVAELAARVKVGRGEVRGLLLHSLLVSPVPALWRELDRSAGAEKRLISGQN